MIPLSLNVLYSHKLAFYGIRLIKNLLMSCAVRCNLGFPRYLSRLVDSRCLPDESPLDATILRCLDVPKAVTT